MRQSDLKVILNWQPGELFYSKFTNISQGYKLVKTCQEFSHEYHCWSYASVAITFPWAIPCSHVPPCPSLAVLLLFSISPTSQWALTACLKTVIPRALDCVRMMVHQQVTTAAWKIHLPNIPIQPGPNKFPVHVLGMGTNIENIW